LRKKNKEIEKNSNPLSYESRVWENPEDHYKKQHSKYKDPYENLRELTDQEKTLLVRKNWETCEYKEITYDHFLNKWYKFLFLTREKNLSWMQRLRLSQILDEFDIHWYLAEARVRKERFCTAIDDRDIEEIRRVRDDCLQSEHFEIYWFWKLLKKRDKQLESYCVHSSSEHTFTNAFAESTNNQCKIAKHVSMGFRYKSNYKKKLSCRFSQIFNRKLS
jgi:hypothetical protein